MQEKGICIAPFNETFQNARCETSKVKKNTVKNTKGKIERKIGSVTLKTFFVFCHTSPQLSLLEDTGSDKTEIRNLLTHLLL